MNYFRITCILVTLLILYFLISTWRFPYEMGWDGELLVGFYRFKVMTYDVVDYGGPNTVWVYEMRGNIWDFLQYCIGLKDPTEFGIDQLRD